MNIIIAKKFKFIIAFLVISLTLIFGCKLVFAVMTSTDGFQIWADVISVGGAEDTLSSSGDFQMRDTFGEPIVGRSTSTTLPQIRAGFREMERGSLTLSITPNSINLGTLSPLTTASSGAVLSFYSDTGDSSVSFSGETLKNGSYSISGIGAVSASSTLGTSQFGFNCIYSSGDILAYSMSPYDQVDRYGFDVGNEVVRTDNPMSTDANFDLNYIANISGTEPDGDYSTSLTFTALGSF